MARFGVWQIAINVRKIQEWNFDCPHRYHSTQPDHPPSLSRTFSLSFIYLFLICLTISFVSVDCFAVR